MYTYTGAGTCTCTRRTFDDNDIADNTRVIGAEIGTKIRARFRPATSRGWETEVVFFFFFFFLIGKTSEIDTRGTYTRAHV